MVVDLKRFERPVKVKLNWKGSEAGVDPFAALSGNEELSLVSMATCSARSDDEIRSAMSQLVVRTALLARRLVSGCERILFLWDPVYAELTIVFTDPSMYIDGPIVTKCRFTQLDEEHSALARTDEDRWDVETGRFSQRVREILALELARAKLPPGMRAYYSDHDRESFSPEEFAVAALTR